MSELCANSYARPYAGLIIRTLCTCTAGDLFSILWRARSILSAFRRNGQRWCGERQWWTGQFTLWPPRPLPPRHFTQLPPWSDHSFILARRVRLFNLNSRASAAKREGGGRGRRPATHRPSQPRSSQTITPVASSHIPSLASSTSTHPSCRPSCLQSECRIQMPRHLLLPLLHSSLSGHPSFELLRYAKWHGWRGWRGWRGRHARHYGSDDGRHGRAWR